MILAEKRKAKKNTVGRKQRMGNIMAGEKQEAEGMVGRKGEEIKESWNFNKGQAPTEEKARE